MRHNDEILAQIGIIQWRLREPAESTESEQDAEIKAPTGDKGGPEAPTAALEVASTPALSATLPPGINLDLTVVTGEAGSELAAKKWLVVGPPDRPAAEQTLLENILRALKVRQIDHAHFGSLVDLSAHVEKLKPSLALLCGAEVAEDLLAEDQPMERYKVTEQAIGAVHLVTLLIPSMAQLLAEPALKRQVWQSLQGVISSP